MNPLSQQHTYAFDLIGGSWRRARTVTAPPGGSFAVPQRAAGVWAAAADVHGGRPRRQAGARQLSTWLPAMDLARTVRVRRRSFPGAGRRLVLRWARPCMRRCSTRWPRRRCRPRTRRCAAGRLASAAAPGCEFPRDGRAGAGDGRPPSAAAASRPISPPGGILDSKYTAPDIADDSRQPVGQCGHFVAWRRMHFAGALPDLPGGRERLEGTAPFPARLHEHAPDPLEMDLGALSGRHPVSPVSCAWMPV